MLDVHFGVLSTCAATVRVVTQWWAFHITGRGTSQSSIPRPSPANMSESQGRSWNIFLNTERWVWYIQKNQFNVDSDQINQINHWTIGFSLRSFPVPRLKLWKSTQVEAHLTPRWTAEAPGGSPSPIVVVLRCCVSSSSRVGLSVVLSVVLTVLPWWFVYRHEWLTLTYAMMWPWRSLHDFTPTCLT